MTHTTLDEIIAICDDFTEAVEKFTATISDGISAYADAVDRWAVRTHRRLSRASVQTLPRKHGARCHTNRTRSRYWRMKRLGL